jgi:hypothetical protein
MENHMIENIYHQWKTNAIKRYHLPLLLSLLTFKVLAQQGSSGNTTIFNGAEMTFFGDHSFVSGGGGTQPGVINTIRTAPFGILNFASSANAATGMDDANYVDGYVRKYGTSPFIFPVGDNAHYGPFAAQGDGTVGAYYFVDPTSAITSMLPSGNYPILPAGGPFPSALSEDTLVEVSTIEYWDIDGTNPTKITLTWDATSDIFNLADSLENLTIAGWNGTEWVKIPSTIDPTSILGGASTFATGSITTNAAIVPGSFTVYTFAKMDHKLPVTLIRFDAIREGTTAQLRWATSEETNSDRFEIERSINGKSWSKIGSIKSTGESKALVNYNFVDDNPVSGENLYRLKMVDYDGTFAYSRIRSLDFEGLKQVSVYPNPVADKFFVKDFAKASGIRIVDMQGKPVYQSSIGRGEINVSKLTAGMHIVEITWLDGNRTAEKILIQK